MTPWTVKQQTLYIKGDLKLTFRKHGQGPMLDVEHHGHKYTASFDPTGEIRSVRPVGVSNAVIDIPPFSK